MAYFAEGTEAMLALEAMVDKVGLTNVLYALEHICYAKAEHVESNWQDRTLAKAWNVDARTMNQSAMKICSSMDARED